MANNKTSSNSNIVDLSFEPIRKKRFRIDGDDNRILELNTSDLNIVVRLREAYPKLVDLAKSSFSDLPDIDSSKDYDFMTDQATTKTIEALKNADKQMRELMDYIFESNVSEICAPDGSMYDPINGQFRFEHIISILGDLYEKDVSSEMGKISKRVKKHTDKYMR